VKKEIYHGPNGDVALEVTTIPRIPTTSTTCSPVPATASTTTNASTAPTSSPVPHLRVSALPHVRRVLSQHFPYSEGIGFIERVKKPTDIDFTYFVTAHELGHQWWAHQLVGADVEGSNMMSESLAEYSALQVMAHKYGRDLMHRFLRHELDTYLRGRAGEFGHEPPLAMVQREQYVWYQKGGQILYTLADYIGEDKLNLALHNFLMQYRYANANNQVDAHDNPRTANSLDVPIPTPACWWTPSALKLRPNFSTWSMTASTASFSTTTELSPRLRRRLPTESTRSRSKWRRARCRPTATARKRPMPLADYIEIGVFSGKKDEEKPLYLKKEKLTEEHKPLRSSSISSQPLPASIPTTSSSTGTPTTT
jgi:ABC-2 type transport system permease protein